MTNKTNEAICKLIGWDETVSTKFPAAGIVWIDQNGALQSTPDFEKSMIKLKKYVIPYLNEQGWKVCISHHEDEQASVRLTKDVLVIQGGKHDTQEEAFCGALLQLANT